MAMVIFGVLLGEERRQIGQGVLVGEFHQDDQRGAAVRSVVVEALGDDDVLQSVSRFSSVCSAWRASSITRGFTNC